ncbi:MAG: efflux RND transporter periplasmic adaptor subunit [Candidatus Omnitrophica bacterium]|nr:efflux RND transporter periplasmic adaptor subunit [Candidatus Omnitrophota bacterium]
MKRNLKVLITLVVVLFAGALIFSFVRSKVRFVGGIPILKKEKKEAPKGATEEVPAPVKVYKVARVSFRDTLPSLGTVKGFREFDLKFPASGVVEYINFKEGEPITKGDIIASLDQKEALLKLEYAKVELEKQTKLFELGSTVEAKLKQSQLEYQSAKAELEKTNLVAVGDGYIGSVEVDRGSYVTTQDRLGMKDIYVEFGVIEKDIAKVKEGQNTEVVVDAYPDQVFKGKVDSVSPLVEGRSRTLKVRSKISNPDEKIKPGMFGRVNVLVYEKDQALVIPSSSFKKKEDKYFVYVVHPENEEAGAASEEATEEKKESAFGTLEIRTIEINYATPDAIEVKEGLDEGESVVVDVEQDLQDKAKVEITETQEGIF